MDEEFEKTIFSYYFNAMLYLSFWQVRTEDRVRRTLYYLYSQVISAWILFMSYMGVLDLFYSIPDVNKMVYNFCFNILIIGTHAKSELVKHNAGTIDRLRRGLYRNPATCKDEEEIAMYVRSVKDTKNLEKIFYACFVVLYPLWFLLGLLSEYRGKREYPLPSRWPSETDINDSKVFYSMCFLQGVFAIFLLLQAIAIDTSMFGLLSEMNREYGFLIKKIVEFGEYCEKMYVEDSVVGGRKVGEINVYLKKKKVKKTLGEIIARQKDLFRFTNYFEYSYNKSMFVHIFAGGSLLCVNGIQAMILSFNFSVKMAYQAGYVFIILFDLLYLCWMTNRISIKCLEVGNTLYTIPWYKLDIDVQKDICLIILRSQRPPRITSGNFVELNLQTSMSILKNIYSWLALFRQVALK